MASSQELDDEHVSLPYKRINQQCGNIWDFGEKPGQQTNRHLIQQSTNLLLMLQQYKMLCFSNVMLKKHECRLKFNCAVLLEDAMT